jgi:hypothetical protein
MGDEGQVHTMEGVVAGLVLVLTLMYITSSITFVSPQTEKSLVMKLDVKAQDILTVLVVEDQPINHSSELSRSVSKWSGIYADDTNYLSTNMKALNDSIFAMIRDSPQHNNTLFNLYLVYDTGANMYKTVPVIFNGVPFDNAASVSKIIVLNKNDVLTSSFWSAADMPKTIEVKLVIWTI